MPAIPVIDFLCCVNVTLKPMKFRLLLAALLLGSLLNGCLLIYFFAPKIRSNHLPELEAYREGRQQYIRHCGRCHLLIDPVFFKQNITIEIILLRYVQQKVISEYEARQIRDYILALTAVKS